MGKLILFKIDSGNFEEGFNLTLQICEDNPDTITHPFSTITGKLPPCQPLTQHYQQWQKSYRSLHQKVRLGSSPQQITRMSNHCQNYASQLKETLHNWYHSPHLSFSRIREKLFSELNKEETIRLLIQTKISELNFLPWHLFFESFLQQFPYAEIALSPVEYNHLKIKPKQRKNIKILAVLGNSEEINLNPDLETLNNLKKAEIITLINPNRKELFTYLYEKEWDLFFFAGHSGKNELTGEGKLSLNREDIITIKEFNKAIIQAIHKGLKLAIFNSCDGLALARDLATLHLSQTIVMTEMIPDIVAHVFIQEFLGSFADNQPLYLAVRQAREKLQPLEKQYPCATWLPIIYQNPASFPLTWQNLEGLDVSPSLSFSQTIKPPENFNYLILETSIHQTQLIIEYNSLKEINTEVIVNYLDKDLSFAEDINKFLLGIGGKNIRGELKQKQVKNLGQILTTNGGNLKVESIFHCVIYDYQQPEMTDLTLVKTMIHRCLTLADSSGFVSLAFPFLPSINSLVTSEKIALVFAEEITNYLQGETNLKTVKIILQNYNPNRHVVDENLYRFYQSFKHFIELKKEIEHRQNLLSDLAEIYQERNMASASEIISLYRDSLHKFEQEFLQNKLLDKIDNNPDKYEDKLDNFSKKINLNKSVIKQEEIVNILPQNYHEKASIIWQNLLEVEDEEEIISLLSQLELDIDGFAWINDQFEVAIASAKAKQQKVNEMMKNKVEELEKGQKLLEKMLVKLYQEGVLKKREEGKERRLLFRDYPKVNLKVNPENLPEEYRREKISYHADRKAIKEAIKQGKDMSELAEIETNLKPQFRLK